MSLTWAQVPCDPQMLTNTCPSLQAFLFLFKQCLAERVCEAPCQGLSIVTRLNLTAVPDSPVRHHGPQFTEEKAECQRGDGACPRPTAWERQQWDSQALGWLSAHSALAEASGPSGGSRVTLVLTLH